MQLTARYERYVEIEERKSLLSMSISVSFYFPSLFPEFLCFDSRVWSFDLCNKTFTAFQYSIDVELLINLFLTNGQLSGILSDCHFQLSHWEVVKCLCLCIAAVVCALFMKLFYYWKPFWVSLWVFEFPLLALNSFKAQQIFFRIKLYGMFANTTKLGPLLEMYG